MKTAKFVGCVLISYLALFFLINNFLYINKPLNINSAATVLISADCAEGTMVGSGVVFRNGDRTFVWTCAHVVSKSVDMSLKINVVNKTANTVFTKTPVGVYSKLFADNQECGHVLAWADIVRYSWADDLAILEVRDPKIFQNSVAFPRNLRYTPKTGTKIFHVGNMHGDGGFHSVVEGLYGKQGIVLDDKIYDRMGMAVQHGSSGGGVFENWDGTCIGIMARILDEKTQHQSYIVPYRRMRSFAERLDCEWALDNRITVPDCYLNDFSDDLIELPLGFIKSLKFAE